jgi:hypothetical protein
MRSSNYQTLVDNINSPNQTTLTSSKTFKPDIDRTMSISVSTRVTSGTRDSEIKLFQGPLAAKKVPAHQQNHLT